MAPITLQDITLSYYTQGLTALRGILFKASQSDPSSETGDPADLLSVRLYPDMYPLSFQVFVCTNMAKETLEKLLGRDLSSHPWNPDEETYQTMDGLFARIDETLQIVESVKPEEIEGTEDKTGLPLTLGVHGTTEMTGRGYVLGYSLPNFFFHLATAYDILRMKGVPLGKRDFLDPIINEHYPEGFSMKKKNAQGGSGGNF